MINDIESSLLHFGYLSTVIIRRYLHKEVFYTLIAITGLLLFIFISEQFVRYIGDAAEGKLPLVIVLKLLLIAIPYLTGILLPLSFFIAVLLAYGRLHVESEMVVLTACGVSRAQIVKITLVQAVVVMGMVSFLSFWANPRLTAYTETLENSAFDAGMLIKTIFPGRFRAFSGGSQVYYVGEVSRDKVQMENIFIAQRNEPKSPNDKTKKQSSSFFGNQSNSELPSWEILSAAAGRLFIDPQTHDRFIVAVKGYGYQGVPGTKEFRYIKYDELGVRIQSKPQKTKAKKMEEISTLVLWNNHSGDPAAAAELQMRFSMPLSVLILGLLAVPLSKANPRLGKYATLLPAILIYIFYSNMTFVSKDWVEKEIIPVFVGVWWLHILMLIVALLLLAAQARWRPLWVLLGKKQGAL